MKALVYTSPYHFEYADHPEPEIGPEEALVRIRAVGICGSDVHGYTGETGRREPPLIMGHEASGTVEAIGERAEKVSVGDRVCFDSTVYCNRCDACRRGEHNRCEKRQVLGVAAPGMPKRHGAMAEYVRLPWWTLLPMPDNLSFEEAALLEPVSIGVHAVNRSSLAADETVLIIGAGTIGLFVLQAARLRKPHLVIVSDPDASRRALAERLGANLVVDPEDEDLVEVVAGQTDGRGVDVAFEVVGIAETLRQSVAAARIGGRIVLVGNLTPRVDLDIQDVISRELTLLGSYASSGEYRECIDLVADGRIDVRPLLSEERPLSEGQEAFDRLHEGAEGLMKIVLKP